MEQETIEIFKLIGLGFALLTLVVILYELYKAHKNKDNPHQSSVNRLTWIIVLCGLTTITSFLGEEYLITFIWLFNVVIWGASLKVEKDKDKMDNKNYSK